LKYSLWRRQKSLIVLGRPEYTKDLKKAMAADSFRPPSTAQYIDAMRAKIRAGGKGGGAAGGGVGARLFVVVDGATDSASSTEIRTRMADAAGHEWLRAKGWMHSAVLTYIATVQNDLFIMTKKRKEKAKKAKAIGKPADAHDKPAPIVQFNFAERK
jgi:hypothetical protein